MTNPLAGILGKFFGPKAGPSVLGVDIGSSSIKVVQLKRKSGRAVLETYGELALGPYGSLEIGRATNLPAAKLSEALKDLLKEAKTNTVSACMTIPLASSLITFIKMPRLSEKQLSQMMPIEARKYIPVPISEVSLDWLVIPREDRFEGSAETVGPSGETIDVLLVVIHNDAIRKATEIASASGLETSFFEIETFGNIRSSLDSGLMTEMIFDMGASSTKLYIVERGLLKTSHTINRGSQDITLAISQSLALSISEAEHLKRAVGLEVRPEQPKVSEVAKLTLDYIFAEANRVLFSYQKHSNKIVSRVILSGGGVLLNGFLSLAQTNFQADVVFTDPFAKVEAPAFLEDVLKTAGPSFAGAIGVALRKLQETA
jgi:type IV pilus assembly protein PilM